MNNYLYIYVYFKDNFSNKKKKAFVFKKNFLLILYISLCLSQLAKIIIYYKILLLLITLMYSFQDLKTF